jgi:hypothetical protein
MKFVENGLNSDNTFKLVLNFQEMVTIHIID